MTFEDDAGAYDQKDAEGFIKLNALRLRLLAWRNAPLTLHALRRAVELSTAVHCEIRGKWKTRLLPA